MINIPFAKLKALCSSADKKKCTAECNKKVKRNAKRRKNTGKQTHKK
jgi:hypothetical protein